MYQLEYVTFNKQEVFNKFLKCDGKDQYSFTILACLFTDCRIHRHCRLLLVACWYVGYKDASSLSTGITMASQFLHLTLVFVIHLSKYIDGKHRLLINVWTFVMTYRLF